MRVNRRELALAAGLLPERGKVLDLACGTGRLSRYLASPTVATFALDTSAPMLTLASEGGVTRPILGDAFKTPFADRSFDAVAALRLTFHYPELEALLSEMRRIVRPGGDLVFDTCSYSPRAVVALVPTRWGGGVYCHPPEIVRALAERLDLSVSATRAAFFVSPYLYRRLPLPLIAALERLEHLAPDRLLCRVYWQLRWEDR